MSEESPKKCQLMRRVYRLQISLQISSLDQLCTVAEFEHKEAVAAKTGTASALEARYKALREARGLLVAALDEERV